MYGIFELVLEGFFFFFVGFRTSYFVKILVLKDTSKRVDICNVSSQVQSMSA